jgi:hypothetical protein
MGSNMKKKICTSVYNIQHNVYVMNQPCHWPWKKSVVYQISWTNDMIDGEHCHCELACNPCCGYSVPI